MNKTLIYGFCFFLFILSFLSNNLILLVFILEIMVLLTITLFSHNQNVSLYNLYSSLTIYFIISALASLFMIIGWIMLIPYLFFTGILCKIGGFPFCWWIYKFYQGIDYGLILFFNTLLKAPLLVIIIFCNVYNNNDTVSLVFVCSLIFASIMLLNSNGSWVFFIGSNGIVSSVVLLILSSTANTVDVVVLFFLGWCYIFLFLYSVYFYNEESNNSNYSMNNNTAFFVVFVLISFPVAAGVVYKSYTIFSLVNGISSFLVCLWVFYSLVEIFWLVNTLFFNSSFSNVDEVSNGRLY
uniref:NADH dehydrogenase subunit 2 n=1 Tax=Pseudochauhanea macrorchis TaxID=1086615 RepID=H6U4R8_PSEMH|nr:NADH dehydrogenase subunit 2 [Pseudochauhanea macrorchis]AEO93254.1 NADH dehydrogenase subunit 2 [Pseudochauhanea macrorchis]